MSRHRAGDWFFYIFKERKTRWDIYLSTEWIVRHCPKDQLVFETGCGCGFNLIWLGQQGFCRLSGSDVKPETIGAAQELASLAGVHANFWEDDALAPANVPAGIRVLVALNWTFLVEGFSLERFLSCYRPNLLESGVVVLDVVDKAYSSLPNNAYLTSDWGKPVEQRKPSEYKVRYSPREVMAAASEAGFEIVHVISRNQEIPKSVYVLRKVDP